MIGSLKAIGFKCFNEVSLELRPLTVLCGRNSGGKSSIVHALLLHQAAARSNDLEVPLNGPFGLMLGESDALINRASSREPEEGFLIEVNNEPITFYPGPSLRVMRTSEHSATARRVHFLSAERVGPRLAQESFFNEGLERLQVGPHGEFTAQVISSKERDKVSEELTPLGSTTSLLVPAIEHYMSAIFGPIEIQVRANGVSPPSLYFKKPGVEEEWHMSSHTGFGLTYALPIIVAGLTLKKGDTLIVDSPEAHLHPAAQTGIARFLARLAGSGVGVIVETHSDYFIEGIRLSVAVDRSVSPKDCVLLSIDDEGEGGARTITSLEISKEGKIPHWPKGFFDQHIINMHSLALPRSN